jgi:hypothetical protein
MVTNSNEVKVEVHLERPPRGEKFSPTKSSVTRDIRLRKVLIPKTFAVVDTAYLQKLAL